MRKQELMQLLKQPHHISQSEAEKLALLTAEFPFFQSAQLLYTLGVRENAPQHFQKQLRKTAIIVNNRAVLYELLHAPKPQVHSIPAAVAEETVQTAEPAVTVDVAEEIQEPVAELHTTAGPETTAEETETQQEETVAEPALPLSNITTTVNDLKVVYITTPSEKEKTQAEPEEKELVPALASSEEQEIQLLKEIENTTSPETEVLSPEQKLNKEIEREVSRNLIDAYVQKEIIRTPELYDTPEKTEAAPLETEEEAEPGSFLDWLRKVRDPSVTLETAISEREQPATDRQEMQEQPEIKAEAPVAEVIAPEVNTKFEEKKKIIDKIIESDPGKIRMNKDKFFSAAKDAKQSLLENEHLITETLAKIYALQGNISKAIRAYEILSLKFPQKSAYFASLIEQLKTK